MRFVCVSDLHLAGPQCPRQVAFLAFLDDLECERLYLCGDIFQHWWHWPGPAGAASPRPFPQYVEVIERLRRFSLGVLPGNHDWHVHEFFRTLGAEVPGADGVLRTSWGSATVALAHGDQADDSAGYRALSAVLRGAAFRAVVNRMTPEQAWRFLGRLAGNGQVRENHALIAAQEAWALRQPEDIVLFGHTHAPRITLVAGNADARGAGPAPRSRTIVNIGDGVSHGTWVEFDSKAAQALRIREFAVPLHPRA